jgi:hypothetical protein
VKIIPRTVHKTCNWNFLIELLLSFFDLVGEI